MSNFSTIDAAEVSRRLTNVPPKDAAAGDMMDEITKEFVYLGEFICATLPPAAGRELALAITNLEQTMFWVKKGFALNQ